MCMYLGGHVFVFVCVCLGFFKGGGGLTKSLVQVLVLSYGTVSHYLLLFVSLG